MKKQLLLIIYISICCISPFFTFGQFNNNIPGTCSGNCITPLNGNGTLGQIYNNAACGLNYVTASNRIGQRFSPAGTGNPSTFTISGIPPCANNPGSILRAYLWAGTSGNGAAMTVSVTNPVGTTQNFPMAIVGSGPDKCWGYTGSYTYRADVTSLITGNGNYTINGFLVGGTNDVDGATLMIIYQDPTANYRGHIVLHDGTVVINGGATTQTVTGINACANSTTARAFGCFADLQFNGATITMNGTAATYAFNWWNYVEVNTNITNGQANSNFTINTAGDCYNFAMAGIYYQTTSCITCPSSSPLTLTMANTNATCNNCDGTATVTPSGYPGPYTYSWAPSGGTGATASGLCAGTYTVTVTAAGGCITRSSTVTITNSGSSINIGTSSTNVTCNTLCNGTASATPTGGTGPYTYSWAPSGGTGANASGLCAGIYTVTVTDAAGCTGSSTVTITQPSALTTTINPVNNITCNGLTNGSATANGNGGTPGYTYSWSPSGGSSATASNLGVGTYTVVITDANSCTSSQTVTITQPSLLSTTGSQINISCNGGTNGSATVTPSGGTTGYTYLWTPSGGTNQTAAGLSQGTYTVTVTDANGCTATRSFTITQPPAMTTTGSQTNVSCFGGTNGTATVTPSGGSTPYTYNWTPSGGTGQTGTNLSAGNYTVTVTDAGGCTITRSYTITQPTIINAIATGTNVNCFGGSNGTASVNASGGTGAFTYNWSPSGGSSQNATNLTAGIYTVTVTDANGCSATSSVTITQPASFTANITSITPVTCNGLTNGSATVTASGGAGGYTYNWTPSGGNSITATNLGAGIYTVTVTDANSCTATTTANVNQPNGLVLSINSQNNPLCNGSLDGSITASATGGNPGYTWSWSPNTSANPSVTGLGAGSYTVTVTDANNCSTSTSVTLNNPPLLNVNITSFGNVTCNGLNDGWAITSTGGGTGNYTYNWAPGNGNVANPTGMSPTTFTVTVTDQNNCTSTSSVTITEPLALTSSISSSTNVSCFGGNNGSATVIANGGTTPYTYLWSNSGNTNPTESGLLAGNYTVTVTDNNNCTSTSSITIIEPPVLSLTVTTPDDQLCIGDSTSLLAIPNGGTPTYTYTWSSGLPSDSIVNVSPLSTQTYTVTVTDANNCTITNTIIINAYPLPIVSFTSSNVCEGSVTPFNSTSTINSGTISSYNWDYGDSTTIGSGSSTTHLYGITGIYNVSLTVVSDQGCTSQLTQPVEVYPNPVPNFTADILNGCEPLCVNFSNLSTISGNANINNSTWSANGMNIGSGNSPYHCFNNPGSYNIELTATSTDGCQSSLTLTNFITVYPMPVAQFFITPNQIPVSDPTVLIQDASVNADSWSWSFGDGNTSNNQNPIHTYADTGQYCINLVVSTNYGCQDQITHCVYVYPEFSIYIPNSFTPNDDKLNDIFNVIGRGIKNFEMYIFNRWGDSIFYTNSITEGWNGLISDGTFAKQDIYVYKIYIEDTKNDTHEFIGRVNLIR